MEREFCVWVCVCDRSDNGINLAFNHSLTNTGKPAHTHVRTTGEAFEWGRGGGGWHQSTYCSLIKLT